MNLKDRLRTLTTDHRWLLYTLIVAVVFRLLFILLIDPNPHVAGGDVGFYLTYGPQLLRNSAPIMSPAPVYLLYVGLIESVVGSESTVQVLRLLNLFWQILLIVA